MTPKHQQRCANCASLKERHGEPYCTAYEERTGNYDWCMAWRKTTRNQRVEMKEARV